MAQQAEEFCTFTAPISFPGFCQGSLLCHFSPTTRRLPETGGVVCSPRHCHQKSCSICQTKTDCLLLCEARLVDGVQPEGPKHHFSVVIGNMIERGAGPFVNLAFTGLSD